MAQRCKEPFYKAPGDTLKGSVDFSGDLPSGVTVSSATSSVVSGGGGLAISATSTSSPNVTVTITGGKKGESYTIEVTATYSDSQVRTFAVDVIVV